MCSGWKACLVFYIQCWFSYSDLVKLQTNKTTKMQLKNFVQNWSFQYWNGLWLFYNDNRRRQRNHAYVLIWCHLLDELLYPISGISGSHTTNCIPLHTWLDADLETLSLRFTSDGSVTESGIDISAYCHSRENVTQYTWSNRGNTFPSDSDCYNSGWFCIFVCTFKLPNCANLDVSYCIIQSV